jgi:magnesium transporter
MLLVAERIKAYAEEVAAHIEAGRYPEAARLSGQLSAERIAGILQAARREQVLPVLQAMRRDRAALVLSELPFEYAADLLEEVAPDMAAGWLALMPADVIADLTEYIVEERLEALLARLPREVRDTVDRLTPYPEGTAGALMSPYFLSVPEGITVRETVSSMRRAPAQSARSSYIYIVDPGGRLAGVVSLRELMLADPSASIDRIMHREVIAARLGDDAEEIAQRIRARALKMLPVVTDEDVLAGVITMEDALELLSYELAEDLSGMGAGNPEESFFTPPRTAIRMRLPWMAANVFLNLGAVAVIAGFEHTIATVAILAAFLPMITDMGGNVGIQALSVSIRSIALGEVRIRDHWQAVRKEVTIGLTNGAALGALFCAIALVMHGNLVIALVAGTALAVNVLLAGVVGGTIPFFIKRMGKDPAMMTGPILTTITDITGVTVYLGLATLFLTGMLGT